jgi:hypothetical protein
MAPADRRFTLLKILFAALLSPAGALVYADNSSATTAPSVFSTAESITLHSVALRVRLGLKDAQPTDWSGGATVSPGQVEEVHAWHWSQSDGLAGDTGWTIHTLRQGGVNGGENETATENRRLPIDESGVILRLAEVGSDSVLKIHTAQGDVTFKLGDLPYGKRLMDLGGGVEVERVPAVGEVAATAADEDYPAVALAKDGTAYITYLSFTHGKDFRGARERVAVPGVAPLNPLINAGSLRKIEKPEDFDYLREPAGGEQLYLRTYKDGKFGEPIAVTDGKLELYRPAIAVDGNGKVWVFYSAHLDANPDGDEGNWELLARAYDPASGTFSEAQNLSNAPGSDFFPAATTDSTGKVWVTWVGGRESTFNVFATHQIDLAAKGDTAASFAPDVRVTKVDADEWEPAIAADHNGNVTVAWDTYLKGDYDVYLSKAKADGSFGDPVPVAATLAFEVRPSVAYDGANRLWIAYERSGNLWGKDYGGEKKKGIPLYLGNRALAVKVLDTSGQWFEPPDIQTAVGVGAKSVVTPVGGPQIVNGKVQPFPAQAFGRARAGVAPAYPRLAVDDAGNVWVAYRGRQLGNQRVGVGSVWFEYLTRLVGDQWLPATWLPRSNNILDNRPALLIEPDHNLLVFFSGDSRGELVPRVVNDPHNGDVTSPSTEQPQAATHQTTANASGGIAGAGGNQNTSRRGRRAGVGGPDPNNDLFVGFVRADDPTTGKTNAAPALSPIAAEVPEAPPPDVQAERQVIAAARAYRYNLNDETLRLWRGEFHRHTELSPDGGGDGGLLDMWRYAIDAASLDWVGDGDHDYGNGREYSWWTTQKTVTLFTLPDHFVPMFSYERSVVYPEGHRNVMFAHRGIRSLPRLPLSAEDSDKPAPDTQMLYDYLHHFDGVTAAHTTATSMGTDWRNNDPVVEPFVEIYQGDRNNYERPDAPRSAVREAQLKQDTPEDESFGGYRPKGFVNLALLKGYRLGFECSSDHISTHLAYTNVITAAPTREAALEAIKKRRVYASTDDIIADVRVKAGGVDHLMGEEFSTTQAPTIHVKLIGTQPFAQVVIIKDDEVVYNEEPQTREVNFEWTDPSPVAGQTSYYYVRGEQIPDPEEPGTTSGELVWASPFWITYQGH